MIAFILIWLLTLDACYTHTSVPQPAPPIFYGEEVAPERPIVAQPEEKPVLKNMNERKHLELLEGQLDWMQKRIRNEKQEWNDR